MENFHNITWIYKKRKDLLSKLKNLKFNLAVTKKLINNIKKSKNLLEQRKTFDDQADVFHKELTELAKKSQDLHAVMMEKVNAMKRDRDRS